MDKEKLHNMLANVRTHVPDFDLATEIMQLVKTGYKYQWQPIETAPRDGTAIIIGRYDDGLWRYIESQYIPVGAHTNTRGWSGWLKGPTYWMPLLDPPETSHD